MKIDDMIAKPGFWPAAILLVSLLSGIIYVVITHNLIDRDAIASRLNADCTAIAADATLKLSCPPDASNGAEIKARMTWAIAAGITAITGSACFFYCLIIPRFLIRKEEDDPLLHLHGRYRRAIWALIALFVVWFLASLSPAIGLETPNLTNVANYVFADPMQAVFAALFPKVNAVSGGDRSIASVIVTFVSPITAVVVVLSTLAYVAVCSAAGAKIPEPKTPAPTDKEVAAQKVEIVAERVRLLNRIVLVASAAFSLAIVATSTFALWPVAFAKALRGASAEPVKSFAGDIEAISAMAPMHWAATVIAFGLPAYLMVSAVLSWKVRDFAVKAEAGKGTANPYAEQSKWLKERDALVDWPTLIKNTFAIFTPLLAGTLSSVTGLLLT